MSSTAAPCASILSQAAVGAILRSPAASHWHVFPSVPPLHRLAAAASVVTLCSYHCKPLFGTFADAQLHLSWPGILVEREWQRTELLRRTW